MDYILMVIFGGGGCRIMMERLGCEYLIEIQRSLFVFSPVQDGLSHAVDITGALPLALTHIDITHHFPPPGLLSQFGLILPALLLLTQVLLGPLAFFVFLLLPVIFELFASIFATLLFEFPFFFLHKSVKIRFSL
jgi:hypothetical protein